MADLALSFLIDRGNLGLPALECNDGQIYHVSDTMLGGAESFARNQITGPYSDGQYTTARQGQNVIEPANIDVWGRKTAFGALSAPQLGANMNALIAAIKQNYFTVTLTIDGYGEMYYCEASDYQRLYQGPRWMARLGQLQIQLMRQPIITVVGAA